jgi:hypothetical protein
MLELRGVGQMSTVVSPSTRERETADQLFEVKAQGSEIQLL